MEGILVTGYEYQAAHDVAISWFGLSVFVSTTNILTNLYLAYFIDEGCFWRITRLDDRRVRAGVKKGSVKPLAGSQLAAQKGLNCFSTNFQRK